MAYSKAGYDLLNIGLMDKENPIKLILKNSTYST